MVLRVHLGKRCLQDTAGEQCWRCPVLVAQMRTYFGKAGSHLVHVHIFSIAARWRGFSCRVGQGTLGQGSADSMGHAEQLSPAYQGASRAVPSPSTLLTGNMLSMVLLLAN